MQPKAIMADVEAVLGQRKAMLTVREFAQITGTSPQNVREACARGDIKAIQGGYGKHYRIHYTQLAPFLQVPA